MSNFFEKDDAALELTVSTDETSTVIFHNATGVKSLS